MEIRELFKSFSRRTSAPTTPTKPLTSEFRTRVLMLCRDTHPHYEFWDEIHTKLSYNLGTPQLSKGKAANKSDDVLLFLGSCEDKHFLDFIEYIFTTEANFRVDKKSFVDNINAFLDLDHLPYVLLPEVWRDTSGGGFAQSILISKPLVIRKDSQLLHQQAVEPALEVLHRAEFAGANKEFMEAHQHFKRAEYGDCLTKCGAAFESVLIIVCKIKGWKYGESDGAALLLKKVMAETGMERFLEKPLIQIALLRNELSTAHGAGDKPRSVSMAKAQYALNLAASATVFIVKEAGL